MANLMTDLSRLDDKPFPLAFFGGFWLITYFFNSCWTSKPRLNTDEHLLLPLIKPVFETKNPRLAALIGAVLSGGFCETLIRPPLSFLGADDCHQPVLPYRRWCQCETCNRATPGEHVTSDSSCQQLF